MNHPEPVYRFAGGSWAADFDAHCRKCGYNVRGLPVEKLCPECSTPVFQSVRGNQLYLCDPVWLRRVARGPRKVWWGAFIFVVAIFTSSLTSLVLNCLGYGLTVYGSWQLTDPDPGGMWSIASERYRRLTRMTLCITSLLMLLSSIAQLNSSHIAAVPSANPLETLFTLIDATGLFALLQYLQMLVLRIPNAALSRRAALLKIALPVCAVAVDILYWIVALAGRKPGGSGAPFALVLLVFLLAYVCFELSYLILLVRLAHRLREQALVASELWTENVIRTGRRSSASRDASAMA